MAALMNRNQSVRMSLREAVRHPYLLTGLMGPMSPPSASSSSDHPSPLDPLTLHLSVPTVFLSAPSDPSVPRSTDAKTKEGKEGSDDHLWARRQFSVLWAPMPVSYTEGTSPRDQGGTPYILGTIPESLIEKNSPFIAAPVARAGIS
jgi:hypothetical protein